MRRLSNKKDHSLMVMGFVANGGKITRCPAKGKPKARSEVKMVEIDVEALPLKLHKFLEE